MRRWSVVAFLVAVMAGCSSNPSSSGGGAGAAGAAPGGGGGGTGQATPGSGGSAGSAGQGGRGGSADGEGGGGMGGGGGTGGAAGEGSGPDGAAGVPDAGAAVDGGGTGAGGAGGPAANPANLIWYADPAKGDAVFKAINADGGCTVTFVDDPEHGKVRKFNRPPGVNRCEAKGAAGYDTKEGDVVYVGMRYKIEAPMDLTVTGVFQWKTYDTPGHPNTLNFPLLIRPSAGRLNVEVQKPAAGAGATGGLSGGTVIWSIPTPIGQWFSIVLGIKQSYDPKVGWVEVYYNGQPQKLADASMRLSCQTLDGGFIDPKWGIYGTSSSPKPQSASFIGDIRIAKDYPAAAPESY